MVANRDIQPGETIFEDKAAAVGPSQTLPLCLECNAKVDTTKNSIMILSGRDHLSFEA